MNNRVLLIIDVQNEYLNGCLPIVDSSISLPLIHQSIRIANAHQIPVVVVQHVSEVGEIEPSAFVPDSHEVEVEKIVQLLPHNLLIQKHKPSCFHNTPLESFLMDIGCDTVVIAGYMTHMCCDTTAREAFHKGYQVEFLKDATGTVNLTTPLGTIDGHSLHETVLKVQSSMFSKVLSVGEWEKSL